MKKKYKNGVIFLTVCALGMGLLSGCAGEDKQNKVTVEPMEKEESYGVSFDIMGGKDVMPIGGFYGPYNAKGSVNANDYPNYLTDDVYEKLSDAGINLIVQSYISGDTYIQDALDLGEKYGIGLMVPDSTLSNPDIAGKKSDLELAEILTNWRNHPAYCGLHVVDEPGSEVYYSEGANGGRMETYAELCTRLSDKLDAFQYVNLLRCYSENVKDPFELYLQQYLDTCAPQVVSYDYYPFHDDTGTTSLYFWNLATMREYTQKAGIPFWTFVQAGGNWGAVNPEEYYPSEGELDWNVNTCLAFGAQGIEYFPVIQPQEFGYNADSGEWDMEVNGLLGVMKNKNRWWYYAQNINRHIAAIDEVLMNSVNKGVIAVGGAEKYLSDIRDARIEGNSWRELASITGDAIVGCFNYQGKTALYVVNYDTEYAQKIPLTFQDTYNIKVVQDTKESYVKADQLTLDMKAGDGVLLVFE